MPKLTKRIVESIEPAAKDVMAWDSETRGFCVKVTPTGKRLYFLYYRTQDGRQRKPKIGEHGIFTCEQAREIAKQWLAEAARGKDPSAERKKIKKTPTLIEFAGRYNQDHSSFTKKPRSIEEEKRLMRLHIFPALGKIKITAVTRADISALHSSMSGTPISANRVRSLLSSMFNMAEVWGVRPEHSNPCRHVKKYKEEKKERFLSVEELRRLSAVLEEYEHAKIEQSAVINAIRLLIFTGCRLNEILTLQWDFIDFHNACLRLPDSKTGAKTVYLAPPALEILSKIEREENNPYVIRGKNDGAHLVNLQKPWRRIRKAAELNDVRIHDLRHSFASIGAAAGLSLPMIGALLGHSDSQTTQRYAHLIGDPVKLAASQIGSRISAAMENKNHSNVMGLHTNNPRGRR